MNLEEFFNNYENNKSRLDEYVTYVEGHKNSKGEPAPWVIKDHDNGKIISSHKSKKAAKSHLQDIYAHK